MLVIRDEQLRVLARVALPNWIAKHLKQFFPRHCAALGEAGLRERVSDGIARAVAHGFTSDVEISHYIDLMFVFGTDFDTDPTLAWPQAILSDRTLSTAQRIERLLEAGSRSGAGV
jgi:hypothetical protein